jgi:hypothetical protein
MTARIFQQAFLTLWVLAITAMFQSPRLAHAADETTHNVLLDKMIGKWVMTGTVDNEKVTHDVQVDRILKGQYLRIHEIAREQDAEGDPAYEAWIHIAWDQANAEYVVMWLDNTAVTNFSPEGVGHGKPEGDRINFKWKMADGSGIQNTFAYKPASDQWFWRIDNVDVAEKKSPFARLALKRR